MTTETKIIKLVIPAELRRKFKTLCSAEGTNMTEKLERYMLELTQQAK